MENETFSKNFYWKMEHLKTIQLKIKVNLN